MRSDWEQLAASTSINVGQVDCTESQNRPLCQMFEIRGFPTLIYFPVGDLNGKMYRFAGQRSLEEFKAFALEGGFAQAAEQGGIPTYETGLRYFLRMIYISFGLLAEDLDRVFDRVPVVSLLPSNVRCALVVSFFVIPMAILVKMLFFDEI